MADEPRLAEPPAPADEPGPPASGGGGLAARAHRARAHFARLRGDSLTRNSFGIMATTCVNAGFGYFYWIAAARLLPAETVGLGATVISAMVIIALSIYMGPGGGLIARLPRRTTREQWLLTNAATHLMCGAATLVLAVAVLFPLATLLHSLHPLAADPALAIWFVLGATSWTAAGLLDDTYVAERRTDLMFKRNAVASALKLAALLVITALPGTPSATGIVATWALSAIVGSLYGVYLCHRNLHRIGRIPHPGRSLTKALREEMGIMARPSLGHHAISAAALIPTYLLPIVVTARLGAQQSAYFYVTWMIGGAIFMISPAVSAAIFAEGSHDDTRLRDLARHSMRTIILLILPAALAVGAAAKLILHIYGPAYAAAGYGLLLILLASSFPDAVTNVAVATLRVRLALGRAAALNISMAVIAVAGAWILAPRHGIVGAGLAWLIAQCAGTAAVIFLRRWLWTPPDATAHATGPEDEASPDARAAAQ